MNDARTRAEQVEALITDKGLTLEEAVSELAKELDLSDADIDALYNEFMTSSKQLPATSACVASALRWAELEDILVSHNLPRQAWTSVYREVQRRGRYNLYQAADAVRSFGEFARAAAADAQPAPTRLTAREAQLVLRAALIVRATAHNLPFEEMKHVVSLLARARDEQLLTEEAAQTKFRDLYGGREEGRRAEQQGVSFTIPKWILAIEYYYDSPYKENHPAPELDGLSKEELKQYFTKV